MKKINKWNTTTKIVIKIDEKYCGITTKKKKKILWDKRNRWSFNWMQDIIWTIDSREREIREIVEMKRSIYEMMRTINLCNRWMDRSIDRSETVINRRNDLFKYQKLSASWEGGDCKTPFFLDSNLHDFYWFICFSYRLKIFINTDNHNHLTDIIIGHDMMQYYNNR